ncbi:MAG: hypothetical protein ACHBNF_04115, partial [Chromatiales bacterium]
FREALRPIYLFFDKQDIDEANLRMRKCPHWEQLETARDEVLKYAPGEGRRPGTGVTKDRGK